MNNLLGVFAVLSLLTFSAPTIGRELGNIETQSAGAVLAFETSSPSPSPSSSTTSHENTTTVSPSASPSTSAAPSETPKTTVSPSPSTSPLATTPFINTISGKTTSIVEVSAGSDITISGRYIAGSSVTGTRVFIAGREAIIRATNTDSITITLSQGLVAGESYELYVSNNKGKSNVKRIKITSSSSTTLKGGCASISGYSMTTGEKCAVFNNPSTTINDSVTLSAALLSFTEDRAGTWGNFKAGVGNVNKTSDDFNWSLAISSGSEKTIKRITVIHNASGEAWSTGYSRYLSDGTDLFGRDEHPYPLVVFSEKGGWGQVNTAYDQTLGAVHPGVQTLKLYGQKENPDFMGGTIIVEFTDGTSARASIEGKNPYSSAINILSLSSQSYSQGSPITVDYWVTQNIKPLTIRISSLNGKDYFIASDSATVGENTITLPAEATNVPADQYKITLCDEKRSDVQCGVSYFTIKSGTDSKASATVIGTPTLIFNYNGRGGALLTATFEVAIDGGTSGVHVYLNQGNNIISFIDQDNNTYNVNSERATFTAMSKTDKILDQYGQTLNVIPAGKTVHFKVVSSVDSRELFGGVYTAKLISISSDTGKVPVLSINNSTKSQVVVGEVAPYISGVTSPITSGEKVTIQGQRLWNTGSSMRLYIDDVATRVTLDGSKDGTTAFFTVPSYLTDGMHTLYVLNIGNGDSNRVSFEVKK